jgi:hypothetical protein
MSLDSRPLLYIPCCTVGVDVLFLFCSFRLSIDFLSHIPRHPFAMGCSLMKTSALDLNEEDVEFLTQNTRFQKDEIKSWYKAFQSDCPDGKLTKAKFVEIYKMFFRSVFCLFVRRNSLSGNITARCFQYWKPRKILRKCLPHI